MNNKIQSISIYNKNPEVNTLEISNNNIEKNKNPKNLNIEQNIDNNNYILDSKSNFLEVNPLQHKLSSSIKQDNFIRNIENEIKTINNILFSRLGKIKVKLADLDNNLSKKLFNKDTKILPRIDIIEITLLNQNESLSELKEYGFAIYAFFLYLLSLLITFFILLIFAFYYLHCIFYKYYKENEDEIFSLLEDYNLLSIASGVQIIKFRKNYIDLYGKEEFLEKYKNFDVFYKEYIFSGVIPIILTFIINFLFIIYIKRVYKSYKIDHPEIKDYSLIFSGINDEDSMIEKLNIDKNKIKQDILNNKFGIKNAEINFTYKLSKYYEQIEEYNELKNKKYELQNKKKENKKVCYFKCCCDYFYELFPCCYKKNEEEIKNEMELLENEMNLIKAYNKLFIITFDNKDDYKKAYDKYPHSYIMNKMKNLCKKERSSFYINKAPNPEDIIWQNLEFDKEYEYFKHIRRNILIFLGFLILSFIINIIGELLANKISDKILVLQIIVNIIFSCIQELLDDWFSGQINNSLIKNSSFWSYSEFKFYSTLIKSIFKFLNIGFFPYLTYLINKHWISDEEEDDDFSNLVERMFVIIEMDGFGYPLIDSIFSQGARQKWEKWNELIEKIMNRRKFIELVNTINENEEGKNKLELQEIFEKEDFELEENFSDVLATYWITMFYFPIYPIGIIQTFLNLLFKFVIEFNFLLKSYKRPEYLDPNIGFFCFNFFHFGFFLLLLGNLIFFKNEDNKESFGTGYIIFMILILIIPFCYLAKFILSITNYCRLDKKESQNYKDIENKIKIDYKMMNLCVQKDGIKEIFSEYKEKGYLEESQYKEILDKLDKLNDIDLYKLQKSFRTPKEIIFQEREIKNIVDLQLKTSIHKYEDMKQKLNIEQNNQFIYNKQRYYTKELQEDDNSKFENDKKQKLYYLLMQLNFLSFLEIGQYSIDKKPAIEIVYEKNFDKNFLRAASLKNDFLKENLTYCDSSYFTTFILKNKLVLAYVENSTNIKLYNIFDRRLMANVEGINYKKEIIRVTYFKEDNKPHLASISLDNTMIISDLSVNDKKKNIYISDIGDTYSKYKDDNNNIFYISAVRHGKGTWIITSYYYDRLFKIYDYESLKKYRDNIDKTRKPQPIRVINGQNIISLEGLFFKADYTFICVRSWFPLGHNCTLNLYINNMFIKQINDINYHSLINFKTIHFLVKSEKYIVIVMINKEFTSYFLKIIDISKMFPYGDLYKDLIVKHEFPSLNYINSGFKNPSDEKIQRVARRTSPIDICNFEIKLHGTEEQINEMKKFIKSDDYAKFNIGKILYWEEGYILVCTPFNYIDVIDYKYNIKVAEIQFSSNIRIYNISKRIKDPVYGYSFIINDDKGKIQYIRPTKFKDKLNIQFIEFKEYFNDLNDEEKLTHVLFSLKFYYRYLIISYLGPLISAIVGHCGDKSSSDDKTLYTVSIVFYSIYAFFGLWFKSCVYDIEDHNHTGRTCTKIMMYLCIMLKVSANIMVSYKFCQRNKTGLYFVLAIFIMFLVQLLINIIIYRCKKKNFLRTYFLGYIFYYISRIIILLFFLLSLFLKANYIETYIYAGILFFLMAYMFMAYYFSSLMKNLTYHSYLQAIFNYPMEWLNLFCCYFDNPKYIIWKIDISCCYWDSFFFCIFRCLFLILISLIFSIIFIINELILFIEECITGVKRRREYDNSIQEFKKLLTKNQEEKIDVEKIIKNEKPVDIEEMMNINTKNQINNDKIDEDEKQIVNSQNLNNDE